MVNHRFSLEKAFQELLYRIDNWISGRSGWILKLIEPQYINISTFQHFNISIYGPLSGGSYVKLFAKLRNSRKGLISIKNNEQKCFLWCHVRHINPVKPHPERIIQEDKKFAKS